MRLIRLLIILLVLVVILILTRVFLLEESPTTKNIQEEKFKVTISPKMTREEGFAFLKKHCHECHNSKNPEGNFDMTPFETIGQIADEYPRWNKVINRIQAGEMPPVENEQPIPEKKEMFLTWLSEGMHREICGKQISSAGSKIRRMNRDEFANTIRDLFGIQINAGQVLPADGAGGEGFDNASETLFISPIHAEKYLEASSIALDYAMKDPASREKFFSQDKALPRKEAARKILTEFLPRAFRRATSEEEISRFLNLFNKAYEQENSYESALKLTLQGVLISPDFLFLYEEPNNSTQPVLANDYELAVRLSYFLWKSMPDEKLFQIASEGKLSDETVFQTETLRMLTDETIISQIRRNSKIRNFVTSFVEQWLGTRVLGNEFKLDPSIAENLDYELERGMKLEPVYFLEEILINNLSLINLIDSDFTFANKALAENYGIKTMNEESLKKVPLKKEDHRGGILSMASILAISSHPNRTSPVLRGKYILETILGTPPPPPPPNVPELEENRKGEEPKTLRERLSRHREDAACASCHNSIDPLGFGLENYDVLGRWRTEVDGLPVDSKGTLPDGTEFNGPDELKQILLERKKQFARHLTRKMLGYALGRGLNNEDICIVDKIVNDLEKDDYRSHTLIKGIVMSIPFRYKMSNKANTSPKVANKEN